MLLVMHPYSRYLDPKNDFAFKRIFGREENKDILISFLNDILDHDHVGKIVDVEFLSPVQDPDIVAKKQSILDVLCRDQEGAQYIVEMQVAKTEGFEKRAQYYAAKAYSAQLLDGERYERLKEVIFIAITDFVMFPEKEAVKSDHILLDKETGTHDLRDLYFTFIELPKFEKGIEELEGNIERWYYYLKHAPETVKEVYQELIKDTPSLARAYEQLERASWSVEELRVYEQVLKIDRDNAAAWRYKLKEAEKKGEKRGEKIGEKRGEKKGIAIGEKKRALEIAHQMLSKGYKLAEIQLLTGLSAAEINAPKD